MKNADANDRNTDAEYGIVANGDAPPPLSPSSSSSPTSRRLPCLLALVAIVVAFELAAHRGLSGAENAPYEPLVAGLDERMGGAFYNGLDPYSDKRSGGEYDVDDLFRRSHGDGGGGVGPVEDIANPPPDPGPVNTRDVVVEDNVTQFVRDRGAGGGGGSSPAGEGGDPATHSPAADEKPHPRIACLLAVNDTVSSGCGSLMKARSEFDVESIPRAEKSRGGKGKSSSGDYNDPRSDETEQCKLSDPSYQALLAAPSTCNDVHALGFRFGPTARRPMRGINDIYPSRHEVKYLTSGGFRSVWTVTHLHDPPGGDGGERRVIMKTNRVTRGWGAHYLDQNRRDVLISERAGGSPSRLDPDTGAPLSNVLPVYQYCAFSSVVPFATAGVLDDYMYDRRHGGRYLSAEEQYDLAVQAARGLYQMQLYRGGMATVAHADVKPPQFLLFDREGDDDGAPPVMQLNDFNRGQFLTRDAGRNETCPFRMCHVHHKGSLYRSPEEYMECADQSDRIDVYSLGGVLFYILSDGRKPWYHVGSYNQGVRYILGDEKPRLPGMDEYEKKISDAETIRKLRERSRHPLFKALKEVMKECWVFEPRDRPSSLRVLQMLEEKYDEVQKSHGSLLTKWTKKIKGRGGG